MRYQGYYDDADLPIRPGSVVTIKKGVMIRSTHPSKQPGPAGRTYKVRVDHVLNGASDTKYVIGQGEVRIPRTNPEIRWAGTGGYWHWVDINDVPEAL